MNSASGDSGGGCGLPNSKQRPEQRGHSIRKGILVMSWARSAEL